MVRDDEFEPVGQHDALGQNRRHPDCSSGYQVKTANPLKKSGFKFEAALFCPAGVSGDKSPHYSLCVPPGLKSSDSPFAGHYQQSKAISTTYPAPDFIISPGTIFLSGVFFSLVDGKIRAVCVNENPCKKGDEKPTLFTYLNFPVTDAFAFDVVALRVEMFDDVAAVLVVADFGQQFDGGQSPNAEDVVRVMKPMKLWRRVVPKRVKVEDGSDSTLKPLDKQPCQNSVSPDFSRPGKPTDSELIESLKGSFRKEL
jgi:hypothetical protein